MRFSVQKTLNAKKFLLQYHTTSSLRILTTNFQSPWNKKEKVETLFSTMMLTELYVQKVTHNKELRIVSFYHKDTLHRRDRTNGWGEVLLIVKDKLICEQITISEGLELAAIRIQTYKNPLIVAASYRPQKYSKEHSKTLFEEIVGLINENKKCLI